MEAPFTFSQTPLPLTSAHAAQVEISEQSMFTFIVDQLNSILGKKMSLVDFDSLEGDDLLNVLADIFHHLSFQVEFAVDQDKQKIYDFLIGTIGYKIPSILAHNFMDSFFSAEKTVIYPVLYWVLKNMKQNSKRVYLARFLTPVEIPEGMEHQDERVRDLYQQYENLRADFIQTHKRVDALRETHADPSEARKRITALENEKEHLQQYIEAALKKLVGVANKDALLQACKLLRIEKEEEVHLVEKDADQEHAWYVAERRLTEMTRRQKQVQRDLQDYHAESIVRRLREDIQANKSLLDNNIPKEINEMRLRNITLQKLNTESIDVTTVKRESDILDDEIAELQLKVRERQRPTEDGSSIETMRTQVQRIAAKKDSVLTELNNITFDHGRLLQQLREKKNRIESYRGQKILSGEDFRKFSNQVRSKAAITKGMKQKREKLRAEWGVLTFTQKYLEEVFQKVKAEIQGNEEALGIHGYSDKAENLSRATDENNIVEEVKGKTLEELSRIVQTTMAVIKDKRNRLNPQINELRVQRQVLTDVVRDWEEKEGNYSLQEGLLMQGVTKLEGEVNTLDEEKGVNETLFHRLNHQMTLLNVLQMRAQDEKEYSVGKKSLDVQGCKSYSELLQRSITAVEIRSKDLQKRRRDIDENHDGNILQVEFFNNLKKILDVKMKGLKQGQGLHYGGLGGGRIRNGNGDDRQIERDIAAVMAANHNRGNDDVDMLVLNNGV